VSLVKSFSVGNGDMFYIRHNSDNFTIVDCVLPATRQKEIVDDIRKRCSDKGVQRFISTHPDQDHLGGLVYLDDQLGLLNFYCVRNKAIKSTPTADFTRYCELRDSAKAFYLSKGCTRRWMNRSDDERKTSGLDIHWPDISNGHYKEALAKAEKAESPNNLSIILRYAVEGGPSFMWMGDIETGFMEKIQDEVDLPQTDVLFAPHHGRDSGRVPADMLKQISPRIIVIGEAPSQHLNYYVGYNTLTQNSAGDITFDVGANQARIYVSSSTYEVDFLQYESPDRTYGNYIGTMILV
jgi:beta-lactamase superfamily II metal-dependent hydrolase